MNVRKTVLCVVVAACVSAGVWADDGALRADGNDGGAEGNAAVAVGTAKTAAPEVNSPKLSLAGVWHGSRCHSGGGAEFGFTLYEDGLVLRDYVTLNGYGGAVGGNSSDFGAILIGDKVQMGGIAFRTDALSFVAYGVVGVEGGVVRAEGTGFWALPLLLSFYGRGGFELRWCMSGRTAQSFFAEYGGGFQCATGDGNGEYSFLDAGFADLSLGYRMYF